MQLFVLALVLGIFAHDAMGEGARAASLLSGWPMLGWVIGPKLLLAALFAVQCHRTQRRLGTRQSHAALRRLGRSTGVYRYLVLLLFANDLRSGLLVQVRAFLGGNWILLDELLVIGPSLAMLLFAWWAYYPVDRAVRQASLISRIDAGLPVYPIWTRGQYLLSQWRHQIALMFVPLMLMVGWIEAVTFVTDRYAARGLIQNVALVQTIMVMAGTGCVFLFAPVMIRWMWDTAPLPASDLRDRLVQMCRQHGVGVRELLLWRTFGGMINAAVMGLIAPVRYILLSDGLLEMMPSEQVEAVMAHEIAHVRKGHMFWLAAAALGAMLALGEGWGIVMEVVAGHFAFADVSQWEPLLGRSLADHLASARYQEFAAALGTIGCWLLTFGWVSRRFERQADTFAVRHMTQMRAAQSVAAGAWDAGPMSGDQAIGIDDGPPHHAPRIDDESVAIMTEALGHVALLNHIGLRKRSWRHGSIHHRQTYLRSLAGHRCDRLAIDREVLCIKLASAALIVIIIAAFTVI